MFANKANGPTRNDGDNNKDDAGKKQYKRRGPGRRMGGNQQRKRPTTPSQQNTASPTPESLNTGEERLHKVLANVGLGSRREMESLIAEGKVEINGTKAKVGQKVKASDRVHVKRRPVNLRFGDNKPQVLLYHKPAGELVTRDDPEERDTVFEGLPKPSHGKWIAVGRLDYNSEGLLIFTTFGELANRLMHPRYEIKREYSVRILGELSPEQEDQLVDGVMLEDGIARALSLERIDVDSDAANHWYRIVMQEGRNREVRRMFEAVGLMVSRLIRVRYGDIDMPSWLKRGQHKLLDDAEVAALLTSVGLRTPEEKAAKLARYSTNPIHLQKQMDAMPGVLAGIEQEDKVKPLTKKDKADLKALDKKIAKEMAAEDRLEKSDIPHAEHQDSESIDSDSQPRLIVPKRVLATRKLSTYTVVNGRAAVAGSALAEAGQILDERDDVPRGKAGYKPHNKKSFGNGFGNKTGKGSKANKIAAKKKPAYVGVYDPFNSISAAPSKANLSPHADEDNFGNLFVPEKKPEHKKIFKKHHEQSKVAPPKNDKRKISVKIDKQGRPARTTPPNANHFDASMAPLDENGMPVFEVPKLYGLNLHTGTDEHKNKQPREGDKPKRPQRRGMRKIVPREPGHHSPDGKGAHD
ncbi:MAG: ribosomal large subunit pseudouridine synthase [Pseudomonadota bacterium]|jgi:23S rRNA pseudouridine2605 synthase